MTWEIFISLVSVTGGAFAIVFGVLNSRRAREQSCRDDAFSLARIEGKVDSVCHGIDDMRLEIRAHGGQIAGLDRRLAVVEGECKNANRRIDTLERK